MGHTQLLLFLLARNGGYCGSELEWGILSFYCFLLARNGGYYDLELELGMRR
jgi:hypothetical protein